jgi:hypothetical protein
VPVDGEANCRNIPDAWPFLDAGLSHETVAFNGEAASGEGTLPVDPESDNGGIRVQAGELLRGGECCKVRRPRVIWRQQQFLSVRNQGQRCKMISSIATASL